MVSLRIFFDQIVRLTACLCIPTGLFAILIGEYYVPDEFAKEIGLPFNVQEELASKNDGDECNNPYTFPEIADWIEENL